MINRIKPNPGDRRQFGRRDTAYDGIVPVPGRPMLSCIVRDLSEGGALLEFQSEDVWLPYKFMLRMPSLGIVTHCEVRHQRYNRVGVMFVGAKPGEKALVDLSKIKPRRGGRPRSGFEDLDCTSSLRQQILGRTSPFGQR